MTGERNGMGVMTHGLPFSELVVEIQYLLKLQVAKLRKYHVAKCPRQMSCCQSLSAFSSSSSSSFYLPNNTTVCTFA